MAMTDEESTPPDNSIELTPDTIQAKESEPGIIEQSIQPNSLQAGSPIGLDWDGPDDTDNPHNWPVWKKVFHAAVPAIYTFALYVPLFKNNICPAH